MEVFNLNIIPGAVAPIIHASQYDEDREFRANLFEGDQVFELTGEEIISVNVRKTDGNVVTAAVVNTGANYVDFSTTEQMTACAGANLCQLRIENSPRKIGTLNFILAVERDPLEGGIQSESEINNLATQVAEMVAEEVATQYDSANVIFDEEPTDNHGIGYTVTSEGIKTAIDNAFDYDNTASGSLVHIEDGADNIPVKSLVSEIVAVESGSGEKSPENPYTISGFDSGIVTRCVKNLFDKSNYMNLTTDYDYITSGGVQYKCKKIYLAKGLTVTISQSASTTSSVVLLMNNVPQVNAGGYFDLRTAGGSKSFTTSEEGCLYIGVYGSNDTDCNARLNECNVQIEVGTATTYEAYNGNTYTFTFGQTVYGGHFDNKGNLVVTHKVVDLGSLNWGDDALHISSTVPDMLSGNYASDLSSYSCEQFVAKQRYVGWVSLVDGEFGINEQTIRCKWSPSTTGADFKTLVTGCKFKYPLATPITLAITSQDIPTLLGENNIFSNCGDVEVEYYTSKSNDILEFIDSEIGKKNGTNIPIEANSQDSIKGYIDNEVSTINTSLSNKASKTEDATITVESGYSLISSSCGKTDRLVHLNFNVEKTGGFATGWQAIGTTDFKPNTLAYCPLWNVTNGVGNGEVRIDTDGTINFYVVTAGEVRLNANIGYVTD